MKFSANVGTFILLAQICAGVGLMRSQLAMLKVEGRTTHIPSLDQRPNLSAKNGATPIVVNSDTFPGADIGARIAAAQASLGNANGVIRVTKAGTLSQPLKLVHGNSLQIEAAIAASAHVILGGNNTINCLGGGSFNTGMDVFTTAKGAANITLHGCKVRGTNVKAVFLSTSGSHIFVENNSVYGMALLNALNGDDVRVDGNTMTGSAQNFNPVVWGGNVTNASFTHNSCNTVGWCFTFFNADANNAKVASRSAVAAFGGHYTIQANRCVNANACYWGSVAHDVIMTGNYASTCTDVCYDVEGCMDVLISGNQGDNGTNGVGATFFFADHVKFDHNDFKNPHGFGIIFVHNSSGAPSANQFLTVSNNTLTCMSTICCAVGGDPVGNVLIENNTIQDGTIHFGGNIGSAEIRHNSLRFTVASQTPFNAISNGILIDSGIYNVTDNTLISLPQPAGSACIMVNAGDYNSSAQVSILRNDTVGFPVDISTTNGGSNAGTKVQWNISGNHARTGVIHHSHTGSNGDAYNENANTLGNP